MLVDHSFQAALPIDAESPYLVIVFFIHALFTQLFFVEAFTIVILIKLFVIVLIIKALPCVL